MVNKKQQNCFWNVDDCKLIHVDPNVNDKLIEVMKPDYKSILKYGSRKMTVNHGKIHKYL